MDCFVPCKRDGRCLQCVHNDLDLCRDQFHAQILQSRRIDWVQEVEVVVPLVRAEQEVPVEQVELVVQEVPVDLAGRSE